MPPLKRQKRKIPSVLRKKVHPFEDKSFLQKIFDALRSQEDLKHGFQNLIEAFFDLQKRYRIQLIISCLSLIALFGTWYYVVFINPSKADPVTTTITVSSSADFNKSYRSDIDTSTVSGQMQLQTGGGAGSWWNTSYLYRKQLTVTNNSAGTITSNTLVKYQFDHAALVTASKALGSGNDVRIVYDTGSGLSEIARLVKDDSDGNSGTSLWNNAATILYFRTQADISGSATTSSYYIYYGYSSASTPPTDIGFGTGADGALTVSSGTTTLDSLAAAINTTMTGNVSAAATQISVTSSSGFAAGDEVFILAARGASTGAYETKIIQSTGSGTITFTQGLTNAYNGSTEKVFVQRIPQYTDVTVALGATLNTTDWNESKAGLVAFRATGTVSIAGTLNLNGKGYLGGRSASSATGEYGESHPGGRSASNSANGGGGGGGGTSGGACGGNNTTRPGTGGTYATVGTQGSGGTSGSLGTVGSTYGANTLSTIFFGSGGGAGGSSWSGYTGAYGNPERGGDGGGIAYIFGNVVTVTGSIVANGTNGSAGGSGGCVDFDSGGAGAGGSIYVTGGAVTAGSSLITATGGTGQTASGSFVTGHVGGNGGAGRIRLEYDTVSGTTNPTYYTQNVSSTPTITAASELTNYQADATYISSAGSNIPIDLVYDAGWVNNPTYAFNATVSLPAGTGITFSMRSSANRVTWTNWYTLPDDDTGSATNYGTTAAHLTSGQSGGVGLTTSRYIQVKADLTTTGGSTPTISDYSLTFSKDTALTGANDYTPSTNTKTTQAFFDAGTNSSTATTTTSGGELQLGTGSASNWLDSNYQYRQQLTVSNTSAGTVASNTLVKVTLDHATLVTASKALSSGNDVRIAYGSGAQTQIARAIQASSSWNNASSVIYFLTQASIASGSPSTPTTDSNYYIYYGYTSAGTPPTNIGFGTGVDGALTVSSGTTTLDSSPKAINTTVTANSASGTSSVTVTSTEGFAPGDEIFITTGRGTNAGQYETKIVQSVGSGTLTFTQTLTNTYNGATDKVFVQRIPQYTDVTVANGATLNITAWNESKAGVVAFRATGTVSIAGTLSVSGKGYLGGQTAAQAIGQYGESHPGARAASSSANGGGGGGGGTSGGTCGGSNTTRPGTGGTYGTVGTQGSGGTSGSLGTVGSTYGTNTLSTIFFGSGGGGGGSSYNNYTTSQTGGSGGGIIYIFGNVVTVTGSLVSNGNNSTAGSSGGCVDRDSGGAGAGGSIYITGGAITAGSSLITASGGTGATASGSLVTGHVGGNGGAGRIRLEYDTVSGTTSPTYYTQNVSTTPSVAASSEVRNVNASGTHDSATSDSQVIDLIWNGGWTEDDNGCAFASTISKPTGTTIAFQIRSATSTSGLSSATYRTLTDESDDAALFCVTAANMPSAVNLPISTSRYMQIKTSLTSTSGNNPVISDYTLNYLKDTVIPSSNPTTSNGYASSAQTVSYTTNTWKNNNAPYFTWSGAADATSGVWGYYVYFGTDATATPSSSGTFQTAATYTASLNSSTQSGNTFYLRLQARDNGENVYTTGTTSAYTMFTYKYDADAPSAPAALVAAPAGYTNVNSFTFTWATAQDTSNATGNSGVSGYYYKSGASGSTDTLTTATSIASITAYQEGANTFYVKSLDTAGNSSSSYTTVSYYYNPSAPTKPTSLTVTPASNTRNSFTFAWGLPEGYSSPIARYGYSINALPTASNVTTTTSTSVGPDAFATQQGVNVFYVVAIDEVGNVNYSAYNSVEFRATTTAPGIPVGVTLTDSSIREEQQFSLTLTWKQSKDAGSGISLYQIYRSTDGTTYTKTSEVTGLGFLDSNLSKTTKYYYKVKACDNAAACSALSSVVSMIPEGRYTEPPNQVGNVGVTAIGIRSATIEWLTDREGSSAVAFGKESTKYDSEQGTADRTKTHKVNLVGLDGGTTYYAVAKWTDEDGNVGTSSEFTFNTADAPSAPTNLKVTPVSNTKNDFTFTWDKPSDEGVTIQGYFYSVNNTPTEDNTSFTQDRTLGPGPYATQQGTNTFYVVAIDSAGNIKYSNYTSVNFEASTPAPQSPKGIIITDASNRDKKIYAVTIVWEEVDVPNETVSSQSTNSGATIFSNQIKYAIERSTDQKSFTEIARTTATGYLDTSLDSTITYYYRVKAIDSAGATSVPSTTVGEQPEGRYTTPPEITAKPEATPGTY